MATANSSVCCQKASSAPPRSRHESVEPPFEGRVVRIIAERLDTSEGAGEFFSHRAAGANGDALSRAPAAVPAIPVTSLNPNSPATKIDASSLSDRIRSERETDDFFDRRANGASSKSLGELLDKAPNRPPDPGDEFED